MTVISRQALPATVGLDADRAAFRAAATAARVEYDQADQAGRDQLAKKWLSSGNSNLALIAAALIAGDRSPLAI